jgi:hypothetical protein
VRPEFEIDKIAEIHRQIDAVLLRDWDPIGVADVPEARDEYCSYVRGVYDIAVASQSAHAIAEFLVRIERESMELTFRPPKQLLPVAQKILELVSDA